MSFFERLKQYGSASSFRALKTWALRAGRDVGDRATSMPSNRAMSVAMALMLISGMWAPILGGASPVQRAQAEWSEECDITDSLLGAAYNTITGAATGCRWIAGDQTDVENLTATDAYATSLALKDSQDSYVSTTNNFVQNTRTVAMSKAKIEVVNGLNNGDSVSVTHNEVNQTIRDYYSRVEVEIIKDWNAKARQIDYLTNTSLSMTLYAQTSAGVGGEITNEGAPSPYPATNYTLRNGSQIEVWALGDAPYPVTPVGEGNGYDGYVVANDPSSGSSPEVLDTSKYGYIGMSYNPQDHASANAQLLNQIQAQSQWAVDNMAEYVPAVYDQYAAGEIDSTDLATSDPSVIASEASTSYNDTGYYSYAAIQLAAVGVGGNVNVSHQLVTGDGTNLNGTLYYTDSDTPADGWATGTTYNFSDYNGTFYFVRSEDTGSRVVELSTYGENFTIQQATNTDTGEEVTATQIQTYTYSTANASNLAAEIEKLKELRAEYQAQQTTGDVGCVAACGDGSSVFPKNGLIYVVIGAAAVLLLSRQ